MKLFLIFTTIIGLSTAQNAPNCPLWGPVYPSPTSVLTKSTAIPKSVQALNKSLSSALRNSTLVTSGISFYVSVFTADQVIFDSSYASPTTNGSLTSGVLNKDTLFRIGSVSKLLTVYSLLAATGLENLNDPVTKWIPELNNATFVNNVSTVRWQDVSIKALANHMVGVRECRYLISIAYEQILTRE